MIIYDQKCMNKAEFDNFNLICFAIIIPVDPAGDHCY